MVLPTGIGAVCFMLTCRQEMWGDGRGSRARIVQQSVDTEIHSSCVADTRAMQQRRLARPRPGALLPQKKRKQQPPLSRPRRRMGARWAEQSHRATGSGVANLEALREAADAGIFHYFRQPGGRQRLRAGARVVSAAPTPSWD